MTEMQGNAGDERGGDRCRRADTAGEPRCATVMVANNRGATIGEHAAMRVATMLEETGAAKAALERRRTVMDLACPQKRNERRVATRVSSTMKSALWTKKMIELGVAASRGGSKTLDENSSRILSSKSIPGEWANRN